MPAAAAAGTGRTAGLDRGQPASRAAVGRGGPGRLATGDVDRVAAGDRAGDDRGTGRSAGALSLPPVGRAFAGRRSGDGPVGGKERGAAVCDADSVSRDLRSQELAACGGGWRAAGVVVVGDGGGRLCCASRCARLGCRVAKRPRHSLGLVRFGYAVFVAAGHGGGQRGPHVFAAAAATGRSPLLWPISAEAANRLGRAWATSIWPSINC